MASSHSQARFTAHGWSAEWIPVQNSYIMPPRSGHVAFTLNDNHVYVFGGYVEEEGSDETNGPPMRYPTNDLWAFDSVSKVWKCVHEASLWGVVDTAAGEKRIPQQRLAAAAVGLSNKALVLGGWDSQEAGTGGVILNNIDILVSVDQRMADSVWKIDPSINLGGPTSRLVAVPLSDKTVLVHNHRCTDHVLLIELPDNVKIKIGLQPTTGTAPSPRGLHAAVGCSRHNKIVVFGGATQSGEMSNELFVLDTTSWKWSKIQVNGDLPTPRASPCFCALDDDDDDDDDNDSGDEGATFVLFGGADRSLVEQDVPLHGCNDLWLLHMSFIGQTAVAKWEPLPVETPPPGRNAATLTPLPNERNAFLLQGGWYPFRTTHRETYLLKLSKN